MTLTLEVRVVTTTYRHLRRPVVAMAVSRLAQRSGKRPWCQNSGTRPVVKARTWSSSINI